MQAQLITLDDALMCSPEQNQMWHLHYGNAALTGTLKLVGFDRLYVRAEGTKVYDSDGREYLDFKGGYGALPFGHNPEAIIAAVQRVVERPNLLQASLSPLAGALQHNLGVVSPGSQLTRSFLCNSGAESVEGAIKTARRYTKRHKVVYTRRGFHGKTLGALSVTGNTHYQEPFGPLVPRCVATIFGELRTQQRELEKGDVAAVIVEPIQGEGGVRTAYDGYLHDLQQECRKHGTLLIVDEVQTGLGRTGTLFACEQEGVIPDILCLAKALGGGVMPVGAFLTTDDIWHESYGGLDTFALHTSTFGGNAWACAAAIASLEYVTRPGFLEEVARKGQLLMDGLKRLQRQYPNVIRDVRGRGLLIGIELGHWFASLLDLPLKGTGSQLLGSLIAGKLLNQHGIITVYTLNNPKVIRVEPPLTVTDEEIQTFLTSLEAVLKEYKGFPALALQTFGDSSKRGLALRLMRGERLI